MRSVALACRGRRIDLAEVGLPLELDALIPGRTPWEVEIGFGKGRFLLARAVDPPAVRLLGIERAGKYFELVERRMARRHIDNTLILLGEALYLLCTVLPAGFARAVHVYFPDPWPKDRHHKRRLFDSDTIDLLLSMLKPHGELFFATDHLDYGEQVAGILESHPVLQVERCEAWPEGPRTNYEIKYEREGRRILRLAARLHSADSLVHPRGVESLAVGVREPPGAAAE